MIYSTCFPIGATIMLDPYPYDCQRLEYERVSWIPQGKGASLAYLEGEIGLRVLFEHLSNLHVQSGYRPAPHGHEFRSMPQLPAEW